MPQFTSPRAQTLLIRKPRNPIVAPAQMRHAGVHASLKRPTRQQARQAVRASVRSLGPDDSSP